MMTRRRTLRKMIETNRWGKRMMTRRRTLRGRETEERKEGPRAVLELI